MENGGIFLGAFFFFISSFLLFESNVGVFQIYIYIYKKNKKNSRKQTMHFDDALFEINPRGWYRRLGTGRFPALKYTVAMLHLIRDLSSTTPRTRSYSPDA